VSVDLKGSITLSSKRTFGSMISTRSWGWANKARSYRLLKAVLHALRDHLADQ
jgi:hypothetical protein